jgi:hypothetical protein
MIRVALTAIAGIGLMVAQVQCVTACVGDICSDLAKSESLPPCHRHHNHSDGKVPASCVHQNLAAPAIMQQTAHVEFPALLDLGAAGQPVTPQAILSVAWAGMPYFSNSSPPGAKGISSVVLRI